MNVLTIECIEIFENDLGFINRNLIYRTEIKNESDGIQKIENYLIRNFITYNKVKDINYNDLMYLYNVQNYNGFWSLIGFKFGSIEV